MPLAWPELLLAGSLVGAVPLAAQQGKELGVQAVGTTSDPALAVAGVYGGLRTSVRTRASVAAGLGASADQLAFRGEVLGHFLLSPNKRVGPGFYFAGGVAAIAGPVERGYMVLAVGLEDRPAAGSGWGVEVGVGGGLRVVLGYRWRWLRTAPAP